MVNGVKVFDIIRVAHDQNYIDLTDGEKDIMKLFGISVEDITLQDWKGVDNAWFRFKHGDIDASVITGAMLYAEITRSSTIEERYDERRVTFQYVTYDAPMTDADKAVINSKFENGTDLKDHYYMDADEEPTWHLAYADVNETIYNRRFVIRPPLITEDRNGKTTYETRIELIYSLKEQALPDAIDLGPLFQKVKDNDVYPPSFVEKLYNENPGSQVGYLENSNDLYEAELVDSYYDIEGNLIEEYNYHLKYSALENLKLKAFAKFIKNVLDFKHTLKEAPWYEKVVAAVVIVIIIIIAIVITVVSVGTTAPATFTAAVAMISAIASAIAITSMIIVFVLTMYATWLTDRGYAGTAMTVGRCVVTFSEIAKYAGYVALVTGGYTTVANGFMKAAAEGAKEGARQGGEIVVKNAAGQLVVPMSTAEIANFVVSWMNSLANLGLEYLNDEDQKKTEALQADVNEQARLIEDYTSPKSMAVVQKQFESGALYEPRIEISSYCYNKTQGLVDSATTKYY